MKLPHSDCPIKSDLTSVRSPERGKTSTNKNTEKSIELEVAFLAYAIAFVAIEKAARNMKWNAWSMCFSRRRQQPKAESERIDFKNLKGFVQMMLRATNKIMVLFYVFESRIAQKRKHKTSSRRSPSAQLGSLSARVRGGFEETNQTENCSK